MRHFFIIASIFSVLLVRAQTDSTKSRFSWDAYAGFYYNHDFNQPINKERPAFTYNHKQTATPSLNLLFVKGMYQSEKFRSTVALMMGDYAKYNLAAEPQVWQHVYEMNAGIKLSKKTQLWLDAGVFASHIGFESAESINCWTLTRSIVAENSPYYESGLKLGYTSANGAWQLNALLVRGWQNIQQPLANAALTPAFQITYTKGHNLFNYSNFFGRMGVGNNRPFRQYHNWYWMHTANTLSWILGLDLGVDHYSNQQRSWVTPVGILRYQLHPKWMLAARYEYFADKKNALGYGALQTSGYSLNADYKANHYITLRAEWKQFNDQKAIFLKDATMSNHNSNLAFAVILAR